MLVRALRAGSASFTLPPGVPGDLIERIAA